MNAVRACALWKLVKCILQYKEWTSHTLVVGNHASVEISRDEGDVR